MLTSKHSLTRKATVLSMSCLLVLGPSFTAIGQQHAQAAKASMQQPVPAKPIEKLTIGKARYEPGETAELTLSFNESADWSGKLVLEFYLVNRLAGKVTRDITVLQGAGSDLTVSWRPPEGDFRGYLVKAYIAGKPDDFKTAAVDVSSDWTHFPRYGYTSDFPSETAAESDAKMKQLSQDYYLNGYQFYDWMWRHDVSVFSQTDAEGKPLKDANGNFIAAPYDTDTSYADLLGRHLYPIAVKQQVEAAQKYGSAAMAYQMNYAARENYEDFGVKREWGLYNKNAQFPNPDPLKYQNGFFFDWVPSALYLQDPGNPEWQAYITEEYNRSVNEFGFDGIHLDQWGASDGDFLYGYDGTERYYSRSYDELIGAVKDSLTENNEAKNDVTFNMVGGNGGYSEVPDPETKTDFDYSELWTDKDNYRDVKKVIEDTKAANGGKAMVIAGYMNYKQAVGDTTPASDITDVAKTVEFLSRIGKAAGWVGDFGKKDEDRIIWTVQAPETGTYDLKLLYGHDNGGGNPAGRLTVNGTLAAAELPFDEKTGWGNPVAEKTVQTVLQAGGNTIELQLNTNDLWLNVDSLTVSGGGYEKEYEAEYAELISCKVDKYGHVYFFETEGDYVTFRVKAEDAGTYPLQFGYTAGTAAVTRDLIVNGETVQEDLTFAKTSGWDSFKNSSAINVPLQAGDNTVTLKLNGETDAGMKLDYLQAGSTRSEAEKAEYGWKPSKMAQIVVRGGKAETVAGNDAAGYLDAFKQKGDYFSLELGAVSESAVYDMQVYYRNEGDTAAARSIYVNGKKAGAFTFPVTGGDWSSIAVPVYLSGGSSVNTVLFKMEGETEAEGIAIDRIELDGVRYEAEAAELGWEPVVAKTGSVAYSLGKTDDHGKAGQTVIFNVVLDEAVEELAFKYRSGNNPAFDILVDDELAAEGVVFGATPGGWDGGMADKVIEAQVPAGAHTVKLVMATDGQYINLDSLVIGGAEYEVEAAAFAPENHGIKTTVGSVSGFEEENDFLTFDMALTDAGSGSLDLALRYKNNGQSKQLAVRSLYINDVKQPDLELAYTGADWTTLEWTGTGFKEGMNKIRLVLEGHDDEGIELDYLLAGDRRLDAEKADSTPAMVIYKDLLLNFGHAGDEAAFPVEVEQAGETSLIFAYSNEGSTSTKTLYIDGEPVLDDKGKPVKIHFTPTANRDSFNEDVYYIVPYLSAGAHTVTLKHEADDKGTIIMRSLTLGFFNEPSIRLMDAALAAMGATHIELGTAESLEEGPNMLAHEYYPNRSKKMKASLKESMKEYYKFFAAYENLLFDSKEDPGKKVSVAAADGSEIAVSKDGSANTLMAIARVNGKNKGFERYDVVQLVNLLNNDENWRNEAAEPEALTDLKVTYGLGVTRKDAPQLKVYTASPDRDGGMFKELSYEWNGTELVITLPSMTYWDMIIIDRGKPKENGNGGSSNAGVILPPAAAAGLRRND
ncbi:carbohydrate-binding protein [Paenibacillus sp. N4]|uniref:glycoside hydrolase family 66 protein n=1 Tax=Paenibacillus vietnamensis TaxID=2590547 RepID=UPI001CD07534|nr:glycoside hydrolase family 66 protein [Paenibacillus vietnamensis]MCA0758500.1 carbohydrate-binding protein [Paenibacillus vietnamensis]